MIRDIVMVGIGGGAGSVLRYLTTVLLSRHMTHKFPVATLAANLAGCFIIGLLLGLFQRHPNIPPHIKLFLTTGFCGGYTTFSAFAAENVHLFQSGNALTAYAYIVGSILGGLAVVWLGISLAKP